MRHPVKKVKTELKSFICMILAMLLLCGCSQNQKTEQPSPVAETVAAQETADEVLDETDENTDDSSPVTMSEEDQLSMEDILANADTMADVAYELADIAMNPEDETLPSEAMAEEMTEYAQQNILDQAAVSVLTQANDLPQQVLSLLGR
mgnify:CR=1 FL=1